MELGEDEVERLREAIEDLYYFEFIFGREQSMRGLRRRDQEPRAARREGWGGQGSHNDEQDGGLEGGVARELI